MNIHQKLKRIRLLRKLHSLYLRVFGGNHFRGTAGNVVWIEGALRRVRIDIHDKGNSIIVRSPQYIQNFRIFINGSGNSIEIDENCLLKDLTLWIEDNNNHIRIGKDTIFCGICQLNCLEGTDIVIGQRCMFANNVNIRTGDSHSILDQNGDRINPSQNIHIGNHIWFGQNVTVLKGAAIADDSICGMGSIVTKKFLDAGVILAGTPAIVVKQNVSWSFERV